MQRARVGDVEIAYERHGEGPAVMLVSGLGGVGSYWNPQIEAFARSFTVITHDHRGTGQSTRFEGEYSVDMLAADALGLMDALGIERAHFVGHSTGGAIAQTLAIEHPARVQSMVQYASWTKADGHVRLCFFVRRSLLRDSGALAYIKATPLFLMPNWWIRDNEETLEKAALDTLDSFPSVEIADARIDAVLAFDRTEQLDTIHTPTLVLCAQDDILTPPYYSEELARRIPGAELVMLEKGGHACSQTTPAEFNEAVLPFLLRKEQ